MPKRTCQRCRKELPESAFEVEGTNYYLHHVCNHCREFMRQRMNYLIGADKAFHNSAREDYEVTVLYRKFLLNENIRTEDLFTKEHPC